MSQKLAQHMREYIRAYESNPEATVAAFNAKKVSVQDSSAIADIANWRQQLSIAQFGNNVTVPSAIVTGSATQDVQSGGSMGVIDGGSIPVSDAHGNSARLQQIYEKLNATGRSDLVGDMGDKLNTVRELEKKVHSSLVGMNTTPMLAPVSNMTQQTGGVASNAALHEYVKSSNDLNEFIDTSLDSLYKRISQ